MNTIDIQILANTKGLGNKNIRKILNYCISNNIDSLKDLKIKNLINVLSASYINKLNILMESDLDTIYRNTKNILQQYKDNNIICISILDTHYSKTLRNSTNPPILLYCRGDIKLLNSFCIATIGTRENTNIGKVITAKTVNFLLENNATIVSGLASGIDEIAHRQTIKQYGKTIAVLPCIDTIYPVSNKQLAQDILDNGGLLISEQKPNTKYHSGYLVKRNRIQSGLSKAVFVMETKVNGGSMHAVEDALKLNRTVYCPDIYKLDCLYQSNIQVTGIKKLIDSNKAIKYSSDDYHDISRKLHKNN